MKRCAMVLLVCAALAGLVSGLAVAAIPVKVASSVGTSEQNYVNVTYGKLVELAQKYSGGAFEFQLYPDMRLGDEQKTVRALQHGELGLLDLVVLPSGGGELIFRDLKGVTQKGVVLVQIIGLQITICIIFGRIHAKLPLSGG